MDAPHVGLRLGRYTLVAPLGAGGMGSVWEATLHGPEGFEKRVALKLLLGGRSAVGPEEERAALVREARIGAWLHHPNVVGTHDLGEVDGRWYVAMELVRGVSLAELSRAGPLPAAALVDAARQVCAGLGHIHGLALDGRPAGLVHRDLKPSNLLLDRTGLVRIADLGIARLSMGAGAATGTLGYVSEEQAAGGGDHRSDLFSLGVSLFQLASGRMPFGTGVPALWRLASVEKLLADGLCGPLDAVVPGLAAIVARCLRQDPAARFPDAGELALALAALRPADGPSLTALLAAQHPELAPETLPTTPRPEASYRTEALAPGNLPASRDPFFGRAGELGALTARVRAGERLLVLKGPGGTGKTRLSLAIAREVARDLDGGSWFVDLSEAVTAAGICSAVATAFHLPLDRQDPVRQLGRAFAYRGRALFVLDNVEQVVDALPETLSRWLDLAPEATFLCTSRVGLRLTGERVVEVEPLATDAAVDLFLDRSPRPPAATERPVVEALVEALERMPLAIELAAARTRLLPLARIRERLSDRLRLLADGDRDRPARQRSLTASLDASVDLLPAWGRDALGQLAVFEGGLTLEAAEGVLDLSAHPDAPWTVDVLGELVDASLLRVDADTGRFRMLVMVQEYARSRLDGRARARAEERHGAWFAAQGSEEAVARWARHGGVEHHQGLLPELDNLVAACRRALARGDGGVASGACVAAGDWLVFRGPLTTLTELATAVAAIPGAPLAGRRRAVSLLATAHLNAGRLDEAAAAQETALRLAEDAADAAAQAFLWGRIGWRLQLQGRAEEAAAASERALAAAARDGTPQAELVALRETAGVHWLAGRLAPAEAAYRRALPLSRRLGDERTEAFCTGNLGLVLAYGGQRKAGFEHLRRAREALAVRGDRRNEALLRINLGLVLQEGGRPREALAEYQAAAEELAAIGDERGRLIAACNRGYVLHELGRTPEAREVLLATAAAAERASDLATELLARSNLGLVAWDSGDDTAEAQWVALLDRAAAGHQLRVAAIVTAQLAAVALERGDAGAAGSWLSRSRAAGDEAGIDRRAWLLGTEGRLRALEGDREGGLAALRDSVEALRAAEDPLWMSQQVQWAALLAERDPVAARALLDGVVGPLESAGYGSGALEARLHRARLLRRLGGDPGPDLAVADALLSVAGYGPGAPLRRLREALR